MNLGTNLFARLMAIMLTGFVLFQLLIVFVTSIPARGDAARPYNLPQPEAAAAMVAAIERCPPGQREQLFDSFNNGLYTVSAASGVVPSRHPMTSDLVALGQYYAAALPGHAVSVDAERPLLGALIGVQPRPARIFAPVTILISLNDGTALQLRSTPSASVQAYLGNRSKFAALAGIITLIVLVLAVRQTTKPLARLSSYVRQYGADLDAEDFPADGMGEVQGLGRAFNEMKGRVRLLMAERTRMLAAIAHDMRTYLTRMRLRAEFMEDGDMQARTIRDLDEMSALIDDTLLLARADAPEAGPAVEIDLARMVPEIVAARDGDAGRVSLTAPEQPLTICARPIALRRILNNLIDNGLRYASHVEVALNRRGNRAILTICDDGPGLSREFIARIGEPFLRGEPSRNRDHGGAGLGLAIVQALAARDGGKLLFGTAPQGGLRVEINYALVAQDQPAQSEPQPLNA